jgi:hypothetical protein
MTTSPKGVRPKSEIERVKDSPFASSLFGNVKLNAPCTTNCLAPVAKVLLERMVWKSER